jgi:hypothetical protein
MKTTNYSLFSMMKTNRPINNGLVKRLQESMNEFGFLESRPVIVDKNFYIIDGQHRFTAAKNLNLPINYAIEDINAESAMIKLNANQVMWRLEEYIMHHASSGIPFYKELLKYNENYKLGASNAIIILCGYSVKAIQIKDGKNFEVNPNTDNIVDFILYSKDLIGFAKTKHFVNAVTILHKKTTPENINKIKSKIQIVRQQVSSTDYLIVFENILNRHKKTSESKIRLA